MKWDKVCNLKKHGRLGIKKARDQNLALLCYLGWKLMNNEEGLWTDVLRRKYLNRILFYNWPKGKKASYV